MLFVGCGHNVLTNYEVKGLDLSVPIFGYPFGVKLGIVKANSNMIRGNASYTFHSNTGSEVSAGTRQETNVIQFSSNTQMNEGNIEKILTSKEVSDDVKKTVVKDFMSSQTAPEIHPTSTHTPTSITISGDNKSIHKTLIKRSDQKSILFSADTILGKVIKLVLNFFLLSTTGRIITFIATIIASYIIVRIVYFIVKKMIVYFLSIVKEDD